HAVVVENRIGGEVGEAAAGRAIVDIGIGPELGDDDLKLGRIEIPAERACDAAAEPDSERIEPPALQPGPCPRPDAPGVEGEIDAAVAQGADSEYREKAVAAVIGGEVGVVGGR